MPLTREEIGRKILHIFSGTMIPAGILYIPRFSHLLPGTLAPWVYPVAIIAVLLALSLIVELVRVRVPPVQRLFSGAFGSMLRKEESHSMTGSTYIFISALICSILFRNRADISFMAISTFILGDAAAALVGLSIGRTRIGSKSLEGSLACLLLCCILYFGVFPVVPLLLEPWEGRMPASIAIAGSLCVTVLELVPLRVTKRIVLNDNLTVPVLTGIMLLLVDTVI